MHAFGLKSQSRKEPSALTRLEALLKQLLGLFSRRNLLGGIFQHVGGDGGLEVNVESVAGGHEVVVVDSFDESLSLVVRTGDENE